MLRALAKFFQIPSGIVPSEIDGLNELAETFRPHPGTSSAAPAMLWEQSQGPLDSEPLGPTLYADLADSERLFG